MKQLFRTAWPRSGARSAHGALEGASETRAEWIAVHLGGRRVGGQWMCLCPAHDDRTPSLSIQECDGQVLVHCHARCGQDEVLAALRKRGLWVEQATGPSLIQRGHVRQTVGANANSARALAIWSKARPASGTLVHDYLDSRGLALRTVPERLRFVPDLRHARSRTSWPAMVAIVTDRDDQPIGVHRTYIARGGSGKAPVDPAKMMLGPVQGGAVRLVLNGEHLLVGEGIETTLAAVELCDQPVSAWAALSAPGLAALELPDAVSSIAIAADPDRAGLDAARAAARRWIREGRQVQILQPVSGEDYAAALTLEPHHD